jgi:hypothetical protein
MTGSESRELRVGTRVIWNAAVNDRSTIAETNWAGVTIRWDNRNQQNIFHNDMGQVERLPANLV